MDGLNLQTIVSLVRRLILMSVRGPTTAVLSFAPPKESTQRKGDPDAAYSLRSSLLNGVAERAIPSPSATCGIHAAPLRANPFKSSGARRGIREKSIPKVGYNPIIGWLFKIWDMPTLGTTFGVDDTFQIAQASYEYNKAVRRNT